VKPDRGDDHVPFNVNLQASMTSVCGPNASEDLPTSTADLTTTFIGAQASATLTLLGESLGGSVSAQMSAPSPCSGTSIDWCQQPGNGLVL